MEEPTATILQEASNCPVVQMSNRKYPGVVIQGDTLFSFAELARRARTSLATDRLDEAADLMEQLEDDLIDYLSFYESVLASQGIELPYFKPTAVPQNPEEKA